MTDLPIASPAPAPATAARALLRAAPARNERNDAPPPGTSPFQDALALELGLGLDGRVALDGRVGLDAVSLPGAGVPSGAAWADGSLERGEDKALASFAADAPLGPVLASMALLPPAFAPGATDPAGLVPDPRQDALADAPAQSATKLELPIGAAAADFAATGKFSAAFAGEIAWSAVGQRSDLPSAIAAVATDRSLPGNSARGGASQIAPGFAARKSGLPSPIATAAPELAVAGKLSPIAEGEIRREVTFAAGLLEQHKAAPAAAIHSGGAAPAQPTPASVAAIEARVGERGWDQGLGDKMVWMAGQKQQVAELHLNPPDLGPLKITLTLNHDQATAQFVSAHASVREAIETAMPRLREMLADSGITLGNTSVGTDAFREQAQPQQESRAYAPAPAAAADPGAVARGEQLLRRARGLVDTFA